MRTLIDIRLASLEFIEMPDWNRQAVLLRGSQAVAEKLFWRAVCLDELQALSVGRKRPSPKLLE